MQLSAYIGEAGHEIESIETKCVIDFQDGSIVSSHLSVNAKVNGITEADFQELVTKAEKNCPISKLLNTKITSEAVLA
jgi:osmotically inducible protein OsmC